jgi:branched-chain amino acid transport system permease protein
MTSLLQNLLNGLAIGSVYALFALGYTLIFSILRIINFAHGAVFTVGAYLTHAFMGNQFGGGSFVFSNKRIPFGLNFWLAMVLGAIVAGLLNIAIERFAFRPLRDRGSDTLLTLVSSLGIAIMVSETIRNLVGADPLPSPEPLKMVADRPSISIAGAQIQTVRIIIFVVAVIVMAGLWYLLNRTKTGKALKAVSEDATTASLLGISTDRLILVTFFLCGFIAAVAGTMVSSNFGTSGPYFGSGFGLIGLSVIILGGLGDVPGAVLAGFLIGILQAFAGVYKIPGLSWLWGTSVKDAIPFVVLFGVLMVRPQGLLGRAQIQKV